MKVAIIGGRDFKNYSLLKSTMSKIKGISCVVSGGALGADYLAEIYAKQNNIHTLIFQADWARFGRSAGPKRNKTIVQNSQLVVAFWDGTSKGTKNTINQAKILGVKVIIVSY